MEDGLPMNSPLKQSGYYRTPKVLLSQLFKENNGGGFKSQLQRNNPRVERPNRTAASSHAYARPTKESLMMLKDYSFNGHQDSLMQ